MGPGPRAPGGKGPLRLPVIRIDIKFVNKLKKKYNQIKYKRANGKLEAIDSCVPEVSESR